MFSLLCAILFPIRSKQYVDALWTFSSSQTLCWLSTTALTLSYILAIGAFLWDIVSRGCSSSREFTPLGILIGVKSWVEQYSPEKTFVRWTRGRIAIGCLVFIGGWGFNLIVAQPTYLLSYGSEIQIMSDWN
ncbi:hypothetical protein Ac2012v2_008169 [Leucoagaricus gongylophorus]